MIRQAIDWGELAPLRIRAREIAEGVLAGSHRSARRGPGIEFGGYREYVPGDDLRWIDRRSLLRHDRLVIRQFETETDRCVCLLVDASASMGYRGPQARQSKVDFSATVAAALARIALTRGDPVSLTFLAGSGGAPVARGATSEQFERVVASLETVQAGGDASLDQAMLGRALESLVRSTRRGAIAVVLSDLLDLPEGAAERMSAMVSAGRVLVVVQTLDPVEATFPFRGTVRLRALEGGPDAVVETDAGEARSKYLEALEGLTEDWRQRVSRRGGRFVRVVTSDPPIRAVREILRVIG